MVAGFEPKALCLLCDVIQEHCRPRRRQRPSVIRLRRLGAPPQYLNSKKLFARHCDRKFIKACLVPNVLSITKTNLTNSYFVSFTALCALGRRVPYKKLVQTYQKPRSLFKNGPFPASFFFFRLLGIVDRE